MARRPVIRSGFCSDLAIQQLGSPAAQSCKVPVVMAELPRYDRTKRRLSAAEGYLILGMPEKALAILEQPGDWATMRFEAAFLTGEALRAVGRYRDAIASLELAAALRPGDVGVAVALGWCYKRTQRLAQAIDALAKAARHHPGEALLHYNLACYWTLAGNPLQAIPALNNALRIDPALQANLSREPDFTALRGRADFERLAAPSDPPSPSVRPTSNRPDPASEEDLP